MAKQTVKKYHNYIGGEWVKSSSGEWFDNLNPADTTDIVGRFPASNQEDVNTAVEAAKYAERRDDIGRFMLSALMQVVAKD